MGALHLSESKKNARNEGAVIVFEDEASFRQTPTLHATWSRRGCQPQIPTRGERNTQKIFGAVRLDNAHFTYLHQEDYFAWETYLAFVDQVLLPTFYRRGHRIYLIQDNASYHKKQETYDYFAQHRRYLEVFQLPPTGRNSTRRSASGTTRASTPPTIASSNRRPNCAAPCSAPLSRSAGGPKKSKDYWPHSFKPNVELFMRRHIESPIFGRLNTKASSTLNARSIYSCPSIQVFGKSSYLYFWRQKSAMTTWRLD
jgi:hypothetical protein